MRGRETEAVTRVSVEVVPYYAKFRRNLITDLWGKYRQSCFCLAVWFRFLTHSDLFCSPYSVCRDRKSRTKHIAISRNITWNNVVFDDRTPKLRH